MRFDKKRNYEKAATTTAAAATFHNSKCIYFECVYTGIYGNSLDRGGHVSEKKLEVQTQCDQWHRYRACTANE